MSSKILARPLEAKASDGGKGAIRSSCSDESSNQWKMKMDRLKLHDAADDSAEPPGDSIHGLPLEYRTPEEWSSVALAQIDLLLSDHAHCEQKAASAGLSIIAKCPDDEVVVTRMIALAQEELHHFRQVHRLILERRGSLGAPRADRYVKHLRAGGFQRSGGLGSRVDLLLINGLIEARSCERFRLLAAGLSYGDGDLDPGDRSRLATFYVRLAAAEGRHWELFYELACRFASAGRVRQRLESLSRLEAEIVADLPLEPRMH